LNVAGTLSVLLRAKDQQLIPLVKPYLDAMQAQGRYFGKALIAEILLVAGE
jgi:predicted nucleic acid-binding protein